jgi:ABC-type phosphate/phosphonate transport system substrate-binding protein/tRNA A-37 threonylcarbamoyl transferase component Bud32
MALVPTINMDETLQCQRCGAKLTGQAVGELCPNCLLKLALDPSPPEESAMTSSSAQPRYFGDYELLERIGRGGMGIVYKARQRNLNRLVALKMVLNWRDASLDTLARFSIEAEAAAKLDHPNIVPTYQIGELNGQPFFSMKLVPGASLAKKIPELALAGKSSRRPAHEALAIVATLMAKVARAVHFAHQHGVIHRDLKPNNILIDPEGEPHLTDFGIAKLLEQDHGLTRTNDVLGTPAYMAPEQAAGKGISPAVDVYSLGAILYELLTGRAPFQGNTPLEILRKAVEEEPVPPTTLNACTDVELSAICLKCLEKNPLHRYGTALAVAEDLERWIRREPILAKRASPAARVVRWGRRNPVGASLIGTLCLGLVAVLVLLSMVNKEKNKTEAAWKQTELAGQIKDEYASEVVALLREELEEMWLSEGSRVLHLSSERWHALSEIPVARVDKKTSIERLSFGLCANESPVNDSQKYAFLLAHLEERLTEIRGRPVRIDLKIYKFKEDRLQALLTNGVSFARVGVSYYLQTTKEHPALQALVEANTRVKTAIFFTRTNSGIHSLADLKGRSVAFGDLVSGITFSAQVKLADSGLTGRDLKEYVFIDSRSEFIEEVHELGYEAALKRRGWLHSTADVIEDVVNGRYDAGMTSLRALEQNKHRGLVSIPGSEFERSLNPWVGGVGLPPDVRRDMVQVLTGLRGQRFLQIVPGRPSGFSEITENSHAPERAAMKRIEGLFPVPPPTSSASNSSAQRSSVEK